MASTSTATGGAMEELDMLVTQEEVNTRCPYTGKEMVEPVKNRHCGHIYDRKGIHLHMKTRPKKALCPVVGCANKKPITPLDLQDDKAMRKIIQARRKRKQGRPSTSFSAMF